METRPTPAPDKWKPMRGPEVASEALKWLLLVVSVLLGAGVAIAVAAVIAGVLVRVAWIAFALGAGW